eukprot:gene3948-7158_t
MLQQQNVEEKEEETKKNIMKEYLQSVKNDIFKSSDSENDTSTENESESEENKEEENETVQIERESILKDYLNEIENKLSFKRKLSVLHERPTIDNIIQKIKLGKIKNIIMMIGAGVSVNAGIPDFRSPKTGLYANLQEYNIPTPESIFELNFFKSNPIPFYKLSKKIYPTNFKPTLTHHLIKILNEKNLLKKCFTQNIDGLERIVGVDEDLIVEAHGTFSAAHCVECKLNYSEDHFKSNIFSNKFPLCNNCDSGLVKPNIVFFGESLPDKFFENINCFNECDLLIIMGTSLSVAPFCNLVHLVSDDCPRLLINRELSGPFIDSYNDDENFRDVTCLGDCDEISEYFLKQLGYEYPICPIVIPTPIFNTKKKRKYK